MDKNEILEYFNQFSKIHNQYSAVKRKYVKLALDDIIYPSEMQVLCLLHAHPSYSLSDISMNLYMTKSAVSQTLKKLRRKGFIEKKRDPYNERYNILHITDKGNVAVETFLHEESRTFGEMLRFIEEHSKSDMKVIGEFLDLLETIFNKKLQ